MVWVKGGVTPYYYRLNGSGSWLLLPGNGILTDHRVGDYLVEVRDSNTPACSVSGMLHLTSDAATVSITDFAVLRQPTCAEAHGAVTFRVTGNSGLPYYYQLKGRDLVTMNVAGAPITLTDLPAGTHTLYVNDRCGADTLEFELPNLDNTVKFTVTASQDILVDCDGLLLREGYIVIHATGGAMPYSYSIDGESWTVFLHGAMDTIFVADRGDYQVEVKSGSCSYMVSGIGISRKDDCGIVLDLTVFLEGVLPGVGPALMTSHLQDPSYWLKPFPGWSNFRLPENNPYPIPGRNYSRINDPLGPAGVVVDWLWVEIWSNFTNIPGPITMTEYDLIERRALLLKPDGKVVDVTGDMPEFRAYSAHDIRIVIQHRNHMSVMSSVELSFFGQDTLTYDFSSGIGQALTPVWAEEQPMQMRNGVSCLWAGDLYIEGAITGQSLALYEFGSRTNLFGGYFPADVTMDGMVNSIDESFVRRNTQRGLFSPTIFYLQR